LSVVATRLIALSNDERATASQYEKLIRPDPAMTANLLKLANSAYFGIPTEISSVHQAVVLLGTKRITEIAVGYAFRQLVPDEVPGYQMDSSGYWLHCIAVAVMAERLAETIKGGTPDLTFTVGLLHDIGKLAVGTFLEDEASKIRAKISDGETDLVAAERSVLGFDHARVGALLADRWKLPRSISEPIRYHHDLDNMSADNPARQVAELVHLADALAHSLGYGADIGELARTVGTDVVMNCGIRVQQLEFVAMDAMQYIEELGEQLGLAKGEEL